MNFDAARIVNQIQHVSKNPGAPGRWPFSTTFAAPDGVAADWFGQVPPQRCLNSGTVCSPTPFAAVAG
jgi:hypothetical protein